MWTKVFLWPPRSIILSLHLQVMLQQFTTHQFTQWIGLIPKFLEPVSENQHTERWPNKLMYSSFWQFLTFYLWVYKCHRMLWTDLCLIKNSSLLLSANVYFYFVINSFMDGWVIQWLSSGRLLTLYIHVSKSDWLIHRRISSDSDTHCNQFMGDISIVIHGLLRYIQTFLVSWKRKIRKNVLSLVIEWNTFINESLDYEGENLGGGKVQEITCIHQPVYYQNTMIFNEIKVCIYSIIYL